MESGKYYVLADGNNLYEGMTKEQILSAITQAVEEHTISDVDTGFVEKIKEQKSGANLKFWVGTTAEYNALPETESGCYYILTDDTTFDDMESAVNEMQASVAEMRATIAGLETPNTVFYGNTGDEPVLGGDTETPVTFNIPIAAQISTYKLYSVVIADTDDLSTATDIQKILIYCDEIRQAEDDFIFLVDSNVNRIEESPELANSLRSVAYEIDIRIEGATTTHRTLSLICDKVHSNLSSRAVTRTKYYLHKLIGIV